MRGIKLGSQRSKVVSANIVQENEYVFTITDDGVAKLSKMDEYPLQGRAGGGVITMRLPKTSREVVAATIGKLDDKIIVLTQKDKPKPLKFKDAKLVKRGAPGGDMLISLNANDYVADIGQFIALYQPVELVPEV
jgi:DNA gyrase subunit A